MTLVFPCHREWYKGFCLSLSTGSGTRGFVGYRSSPTVHGGLRRLGVPMKEQALPSEAKKSIGSRAKLNASLGKEPSRSATTVKTPACVSR